MVTHARWLRARERADTRKLDESSKKMHAHDIAKPATDILAHILEDDEVIPNSRLPLLIYRAALSLPDREQTAAVEELLAGNGWSGSWRSFGIRTGSGCWKPDL